MENSENAKRSSAIDVLIGAGAALIVCAIGFVVWQVFSSDSEATSTLSPVETTTVTQPGTPESSASSVTTVESTTTTAPPAAAAFNIDAIHALEEELSAGTIEPSRQIPILEEQLLALNLDPTVAGSEGMREIMVPLIAALKAVETDPTETTRVKDLAYQLHGLGHESGHNH